MIDSDLAYAAGILDGEGCIFIRRVGSGANSLRVTVGNTDPQMVYWMKDLFGGSVHRQKKMIPNRRPIWIWNINAAKAAECLRQVRPFLKTKAEQAGLGIALHELGVGNGQIGGYHPRLLPEVVEQRANIDGLLRLVKRRHAGDCHCNICIGAPVGLPSEDVKYAT